MSDQPSEWAMERAWRLLNDGLRTDTAQGTQWAARNIAAALDEARRLASEKGGTGPWAMRPDGISLRDWFAGQAIAGKADMLEDEKTVEWAYELADIMLVQRRKGKHDAPGAPEEAR